jgi:hypothetical protein
MMTLAFMDWDLKFKTASTDRLLVYRRTGDDTGGGYRNKCRAAEKPGETGVKDGWWERLWRCSVDGSREGAVHVTSPTLFEFEVIRLCYARFTEFLVCRP